MTTRFADPTDMQHKLFAELSSMFGDEVPLYDKSLAVNLRCNRAVVDMLGSGFDGFTMSDESILRTSRERHGAIRIGREDEFRWITRFFTCFGMEPHNYYDMTTIGAKSQPVTATAFRSACDPQNRVFASLLRTDYFEADMARRIDELLSSRQVFSERARALVERCELQGGLDPDDAEMLIAEGTTRIFKWTGEARGRELYDDLCAEGFKIAADIACFSSHHLNHLTPNTLCIDLYSDAMKWRLGVIERSTFIERAEATIEFLDGMADPHWLLLHFRDLGHDDVISYGRSRVTKQRRREIIESLTESLDTKELDLAALDHNGYKDETEGPTPGTQILLRQDAYRALTEPIRFIDEQPVFCSEHTARFGEIEQRFYAATPRGRKLYDRCLLEHTSARDPQPILQTGDERPSHGGRSETPSNPFTSFPPTLEGMIREGLVYATFEPTPDALLNTDSIRSTDVIQLIDQGHLRFRGMRYEDFLPISAAGIFASNLDQYGTDSTAEERPHYGREEFEAILDRTVIDVDVTYRAMQAKSLLASFEALGTDHLLDEAERHALESDIAAGYAHRALGGEETQGSAPAGE